MTAAVAVVLDNEAVQALSRVTHPKHRRVLSFIDEVNQRNQRRRLQTSVVIPVGVRVEAGWDRTARDASLPDGNLRPGRDHPPAPSAGAAGLQRYGLQQYEGPPARHPGATVRYFRFAGGCVT